ncbi:MAG: type II toxin-antitoxin system VapC family toxin [Patulibacter sp.]
MGRRAVIVLDTHAWLWWTAARDRLSPAAATAIDTADVVGVSAISAWEVAMLAQRGRIALDRPAARWVNEAAAIDPRITLLDLDAAIAVDAAALGTRGMHGDPADRFIYATAQHHRAALVTRDAALRAFDPSGTVW